MILGIVFSVFEKQKPKGERKKQFPKPAMRSPFFPHFLDPVPQGVFLKILWLTLAPFGTFGFLFCCFCYLFGSILASIFSFRHPNLSSACNTTTATLVERIPPHQGHVLNIAAGT